VRDGSASGIRRLVRHVRVPVALLAATKLDVREATRTAGKGVDGCVIDIIRKELDVDGASQNISIALFGSSGTYRWLSRCLARGLDEVAVSAARKHLKRLVRRMHRDERPQE
jgi:hypothetical protein